MKNRPYKKVVFITGTPGVGKTTVTSFLQKRIPCHLISVNELLQKKNLFQSTESERDYKTVDVPSFCKELKSEISKLDGLILVESHLTHYCPESDLVIVLRLNPEILEERLKKRRYKPLKIQENLEAEALGVCLQESYQIHGNKVQEIDTSNLSPDKVSDKILGIIRGKNKYSPGRVDFLDWFMEKKC